MDTPKERAQLRVNYTLVVTILSVALIGAMNITFSVYLFRQFCGLVITMDNVYRDAPPVTPTGKEMARDIAHIRNGIFCQ